MTEYIADKVTAETNSGRPKARQVVSPLSGKASISSIFALVSLLNEQKHRTYEFGAEEKAMLQWWAMVAMLCPTQTAEPSLAVQCLHCRRLSIGTESPEPSSTVTNCSRITTELSRHSTASTAQTFASLIPLVCFLPLLLCDSNLFQNITKIRTKTKKCCELRLVRLKVSDQRSDISGQNISCLLARRAPTLDSLSTQRGIRTSMHCI